MDSNQINQTHNNQVASQQPVAPQPEVTPQPIPQAQEETPQPSNTVQAPDLSNTNPTVEQSTESFVQSTQALNSEKTVEKKKGVNYLLVILLFIIVLIAIFFVFPLLKEYI